MSMGLIEQKQYRSMKQVQQTSSEQVSTEGQGKSEEQLPEKTVGRLSAKIFSG